MSTFCMLKSVDSLNGLMYEMIENCTLDHHMKLKINQIIVLLLLITMASSCGISQKGRNGRGGCNCPNNVR